MIWLDAPVIAFAYIDSEHSMINQIDAKEEKKDTTTTKRNDTKEMFICDWFRNKSLTNLNWNSNAFAINLDLVTEMDIFICVCYIEFVICNSTNLPLSVTNRHVKFARSHIDFIIMHSQQIVAV